MKKIFVVMLILVVAGQLVFAGGGQSAAGTGKKTVSFYHWDSGAVQLRRQQQIRDFNVKFPNVNVEENMVPWEEYHPKINTMVAAGAPPDLWQFGEYLVNEWGERGVLEDLKPFYVSKGMAPEDRFVKGSLFLSGGHVWGVGMGGGVILLYYNKELFRRAGVTPPPTKVNEAWTWAQFVDAAKKLTRDSNGRTPNDSGFNYNSVVQWGAVTPTSWQPNLSFLYSVGVGIANPQGTQTLIADPKTIQIYQALADLSLKDRAAPDTAMASSSAFENKAALLMNGQLAMNIAGQWEYGPYEDDKFDVGVGVIPTFGSKSICMTWDNGLVAKKGASQEALELHAVLTDTNDMVRACKKGNIPLSGVLPVTRNTLTDSALTREWNSMLNPNFSSVVQEVVLNGTYLAENITLKNFNDIVLQNVQPTLDRIFLGEVSAQQGLTDLRPKVQSLLKGAYQ